MPDISEKISRKKAPDKEGKGKLKKFQDIVKAAQQESESSSIEMTVDLITPQFSYLSVDGPLQVLHFHQKEKVTNIPASSFRRLGDFELMTVDQITASIEESDNGNTGSEKAQLYCILEASNVTLKPTDLYITNYIGIARDLCLRESFMRQTMLIGGDFMNAINIGSGLEMLGKVGLGIGGIDLSKFSVVTTYEKAIEDIVKKHRELGLVK